MRSPAQVLPRLHGGDRASWDRAYDNRGAVTGAQDILDRWQKDAHRFRYDANIAAQYNQPYGDHPRHCYDGFATTPPARGSVIFVHGGYWRALDKSFFSHLAFPFVARGFDVFMLNYPLVPDTGVPDITRAVSKALHKLLPIMVDPVHLIGHSVGGHLVMRQICTDIFSTLPAHHKIASATSISGVHDLRPLLKLSLNAEFGLDMATAQAQSPCNHHPAPNIRINTIVGGDELPAFIEQSQLLVKAWQNCAYIQIENRNHFTILDEIMQSNSEIIAHIL